MGKTLRKWWKDARNGTLAIMDGIEGLVPENI